jgi:hypothetical protein
MLTAEQRARFDAEGFVRLPGAFAKEAADAMAARVWRFLERKHGTRPDEPATWRAGAVYGLQGMKREPVFDAIGGPAVCAALDDLVGAGDWERPRDWGGFLVTFPSPGPWAVPGRVWHTDFDFRGPAEPLRGALVLSFLSDVPPGGGGTLAVAGSHRLLRAFVEARPSAGREKMKATRTAFLASEPWLRELASPEAAPDRRERLMGRATPVRGVPLRVVELDGAPGDVVLGHPWLLHNGSPNCGNAPRLMRVARLRRAARSPV